MHSQSRRPFIEPTRSDPPPQNLRETSVPFAANAHGNIWHLATGRMTPSIDAIEGHSERAVIERNRSILTQSRY